MINEAQVNDLETLFPVLSRLDRDQRQLLYTSGQIIELPASQMLMQQNQQCQIGRAHV